MDTQFGLMRLTRPHHLHHATVSPFSRGRSPIKGMKIHDGTVLRCECGSEWRTNQFSPSGGGRKWAEDLYFDHLDEVRTRTGLARLVVERQRDAYNRFHNGGSSRTTAKLYAQARKLYEQLTDFVEPVPIEQLLRLPEEAMIDDAKLQTFYGSQARYGSEHVTRYRVIFPDQQAPWTYYLTSDGYVIYEGRTRWFQIFGTTAEGEHLCGTIALAYDAICEHREAHGGPFLIGT